MRSTPSVLFSVWRGLSVTHILADFFLEHPAYLFFVQHLYWFCEVVPAPRLPTP